MKHASISGFVDKVQTWDPRKQGAEDRFHYIDIGSVSQVSKTIEDPPIVLGAEAPSRARQIVKGGDILVSTVRPNLNAVALVPDELDGSTASTGFSILRPDDAQLDRNYLFHWVRTQAFVSEMMKQATGQSYPAVSDKIVKATQIPLPPLDEQRRIAGILDQADALRRLRTRALDKLNTLGQAIFHEMFGDPTAQETEHLQKPLIDFVHSKRPITYGILKPGENQPDGVPYIRVVDMVGDSISFAQIKRTSEEIALSYKRSRLQSGDLLMSIRGHVGRTSIVPKELEGANITQDTARLAVPSDEAEYFRYTILHPAIQNWMSQRIRGAAVKGINLGDLKQLPVLDVPHCERVAFSQKIAKLRESRQKVVCAQDSSALLFASLQHRAFRGEL